MVRWPRSGRRAPRENSQVKRIVSQPGPPGVARSSACSHLFSGLLLGLPKRSTVGISPIATMRKPTTATRLTYPFSTP